MGWIASFIFIPRHLGGGSRPPHRSLSPLAVGRVMEGGASTPPPLLACGPRPHTHRPTHPVCHCGPRLPAHPSPPPAGAGSRRDGPGGGPGHGAQCIGQQSTASGSPHNWGGEAHISHLGRYSGEPQSRTPASALMPGLGWAVGHAFLRDTAAISTSEVSCSQPDDSLGWACLTACALSRVEGYVICHLSDRGTPLPRSPGGPQGIHTTSSCRWPPPLSALAGGHPLHMGTKPSKYDA